MTKKLFITAMLIISAVFNASWAVADTAREKLNTFVQTVVTFKADFTQTVLDQQGQVKEEAQGVFALERPGKFRWDYKTPFPQQIVADGQHIWFYDVDLEQVTVKSQQEALSDTPASLLSGETLPEDKYSLIELDNNDGLYWIQLIPKDEESNYQTVTLAFNDKGLYQMLMKDSFEQRTRLVFTQTQENHELSEDEFVFTPPEGVDVVGDVKGQ
jgi:outer membrane lipoprotein carrier protein